MNTNSLPLHEADIPAVDTHREKPKQPRHPLTTQAVPGSGGEVPTPITPSSPSFNVPSS